MSNFLENIILPHGRLEIIVQDYKTKEIVDYYEDGNQIQDWTKHALSHLSAGRLFATYGNHGEEVTDVGNAFSIDHYIDGGDTGETVSASPWSYSNAHNGLIQLRDGIQGNIQGGAADPGTPLYPFFPTKMRFGIGGLNASLQPKDDVPTDATRLQAADGTCPFVVVDRNRIGDTHITLSQSSANTINKVTYSCKLPGGSSDYPYNGKVISEAGLFCDAGLILEGNTDMRTGMMLAYRTFYGITKNESIDITFNWSWLM